MVVPIQDLVVVSVTDWSGTLDPEMLGSIPVGEG